MAKKHIIIDEDLHTELSMWKVKERLGSMGKLVRNIFEFYKKNNK